MILGITGRVGVGKSTAVKIIKDQYKESIIFDLDLIGHELLNENHIKKELSKEFGDKIFDSNGVIKRQALGNIVFNNKKKLSNLNKVIHPKIKSTVLNQLNNINLSSNLIIIVGALIEEIGLNSTCTKIIVIDADDKKIIEKIGGKYVKISKHQRSKEEYCQNSDKVILNNFDDKFNFDILKYIKDYQ